MKKILTTLAVGLVSLAFVTAADAATGSRVGPTIKTTDVNVTNGPSNYNMSIDVWYGYSDGRRMDGQSSHLVLKYSYIPAVNGEMNASFTLLEASGSMAQDWNNQGTFRDVGWGFGGAAGLDANSVSYWDDIIRVANNTKICPGRTQAIVDLKGNVLASYSGSNGAESVLTINQAAYNKFLNDNKSTESVIKSVSSSVSYAYVDGVLTPIEKEVIEREDHDVYNLAVTKTVSPIVLDITNSGKIQASNGQYLPHAGVDFKNTIIADFYGDGFEVAMEWVGPNDGLLVAPKADGTVDMSCLFGTAGGYDNGYQKLALYADANGIVKGDALKSLAVWQDANGNGIADAGEVKSCTELGITSINANHKMFASTFEMNGKTQKMWDWWPNACELQKIASK